MYYVIAPTSNDIQHHGILGQRWGKRNGPPYPLSNSAHSRSEVTAGWQRSVKSIDTSTTGISQKRVKTKKFHDSELNNAYNAINNVEEVERRVHRNSGIVDYLTPAEVINAFENDLGMNPYEMEPEDFSVAVENVNPDYGERGTTNNCSRCSAAMELRNRGYDVIAARAHNGASAFEFETWFDGAKTKGYSSAEDMMKDILRNGEGSSGALCAYFGQGLGSGAGGHALHWSVKDRHVQIEDGQNGQIFNSFNEAYQYYGFNKGACFSTRLDNCKPNWSEMEKDSVIGVNNSGRRWRQNDTIFKNF